jgi:hypothetical protein
MEQFSKRRKWTGGGMLSRAAMAAMVLMIFGEIPLKAYADPGSGLLVWQIVGAFFVGSAWQIRRFFSRVRKRK